MSKDKRKRTNNDWLMQRTGLLIVYSWVMLAVGFFILTAWEPMYLESSEDYVTILGIIGGPALLVVTKIIETWNQEKQNEINDYEAQASHERDMDGIMVRHRADMERNPHCHEDSEKDKTDGVQDARIQNMESQIAELVAEVVMLREEGNSSSKSTSKK